MMKPSIPETPTLSPIIEPIDTSSLADKVELKLVKFFLDNNMKPGDQVPKEMTLAETLKVSRTVIREALQRLRMTGLIETRKKRGAVLSNPDLLSLLQKTMYPSMLDDTTLRNMFEMRMVLEIGMADLIVQRIRDEDIKELESIVKVEPEQSMNIVFNIDQEVRFHGKLYEITGNTTLIRFQHMLLPIFKFVHESGLLEKPKKKSSKYVSHKEIVRILKKRDAELLRNAMSRHFENHFQRIFER